MPRKRREAGVLNILGTTLQDAQALRQVIYDRLRRYNDPLLSRMGDETRRLLASRLTNAVEMARLGLPEMPGSRVKPREWTLEQLVYDVSNALHQAGVSIKPHQDLLVNPAQALSREFAVMAGLAERVDEVGTLYKPALRARRILASGDDWSDVWLDGRMVAKLV